MDFMTWTNDLSVGVAVMDDDHKKLIGIINQLHYGIKAGHDREILGAVLGQLMEYTRFHFAREEEFFLKTNYLGAATHKKEHENFVSRISNLQTRFKSAPAVMLDLELMRFLRDWLLTHIRGSDKKYGPHFNTQGFF
ncbi:MAG: bacteriohemerythrin [Terracidiphilus sp.]